MKRTTHRFEELEYILYEPQGATDSERPLPLLIFLHGRDESVKATKLTPPITALETRGLPQLASEGRLPRVEGRAFPFVVAAPQALQLWREETTADRVVRLADSLIEERRLDPGRCYLTGLSMGGQATWAIAHRRPDRFAALAPISCPAKEESRVVVEAGIPAWTFTGGDDRTFDVGNLKEDIERLRAEGATIELTIDPQGAHNAGFWERVYGRADLYEWLLAHGRTARAGRGGAGG